MSIPSGPDMGPVTYPDSPRIYIDVERDTAGFPPPAPPASAARQPRRGPSAGVVIGLIAGAGLIAITAGTIGGGVGYLVARETLPAATVQQAVAAGTGAELPSVVPGSIAEIAARVQPAVVQLNVSGSQGEGTGSGFVVREDGYIITNNHVAGIAGDGGTIDVVFSDGSTRTGKLVGTSPDYDLAVVKVDGAKLPTVPLGSSADLAVGDSVIAVGSPLGLSGTVTTGIVSALNRPVTAGGESEGTSFINAIQTDAAINPGNSGGPLLDGNGAVIGVNSAIATMGASAGAQAGSIGLGFAIPIDTVKRITDEIRATGHASTPIIGVELDMQYTGPGAQVSTITQGGPAQAAGLKKGDLITEVDGTTMADPTQLIVVLRSQAPGDTVTLTVERDGQTLQIPITLGTAGAVNS